MILQDIEKKVPFLFSAKWHNYIIFFAALALYCNTLRNGFALDDKVVFTENQFVQKGFSGISDILSFDSFRGYFKDARSAELVAGGRYRPFSLMIFSGIVQVFGNKPMIAHILNILLFGLTGVLLYNLLNRLLRYKYSALSIPLSFLSALIFVLHPIHTEAVANIKGLDEILSLLFSLSAGYFLLNYPGDKKLHNLILAGILYLLALYSKENALVFLGIYPLCYFLFIRKTENFPLAIITSFIVPPIIYLTHRTMVLGKSTFIETSNDFLNNNFLIMRGERLVEMNLPERLGMIFYSFYKYLQLLIFPYPLTHDYNPKVIPAQHLFSPIPFIALVIYLSLVFLLFRYWNKRPIISLSIGIYLISLLPVSNLFFPIGTAMAERFIYFSSIGFCIAAAYLILYLLQSRIKVAALFIFVLVAGYSAQTFYRNTAWKDDQTLFNRDYKHSSKSAKLNSALGLSLLDSYRSSPNKDNELGKLEQSIFHLEKAVQIFPAYYQCVFLLGNAQYLKKDYPAAIKTYEKYIEKNPDDVSIIKNYQKALRELGRDLVHNQKKYEEAKVELLKAYKLAPNDAATLELLGIAEAETGYLDNSIGYLKHAIEIEPGSATAWANLYISYSRKGDKFNAQYAVQKAMELDKEVVKKLMTVDVK